MADLVGIAASPWTERARWALDHHHISHDFVAYTPMLGEPGLRTRLRRARGQVSVPVLFDAERVVEGALGIAKHADASGRRKRLFPPERQGALDELNSRAEAGLSAGRALLFARLLTHPVALTEQGPAWVPEMLRAASARAAVQFLAAKYQTDSETAEVQEARLREVLGELRNRIAVRGGYVLDEFTYGDIAMATVLQLIDPPAGDHLGLGEASRRAWRHPSLAIEFGDLLAWRDSLYARYRARLTP